ncbi:MAG: hypothetical protein HQL94_11920 [Magnetococcales bacterium]|nr:hypothetical protein [Magnetococcales bacterium]
MNFLSNLCELSVELIRQDSSALIIVSASGMSIAILAAFCGKNLRRWARVLPWTRNTGMVSWGERWTKR